MSHYFVLPRVIRLLVYTKNWFIFISNKNLTLQIGYSLPWMNGLAWTEIKKEVANILWTSNCLILLKLRQIKFVFLTERRLIWIRNVSALNNSFSNMVALMYLF